MTTAALTPGLPALKYNAQLVTVNAAGNQVANLFTMQSFQTGSTVQFVSNQLKNGISWIPIRRAEIFIAFSGIWSHQRYEEMYAFLNSIRIHHLACVNYASPPLMTLVYETQGVSYNGLVEDAPMGDTRFQALYTKQFNMEMVPGLFETPSAVTTNAGYLPTSTNVTKYGAGWYSVQPGQQIGSTTDSTTGTQPPGLSSVLGGLGLTPLGNL